MNMDLIKELQTVVAPQTFTPPGVYDGRKNLFAVRELPFGGSGSQEVKQTSFVLSLRLTLIHLQFDVSLPDSRSGASSKGPKVYKIKLTKVAEINPE